MANGNNQNSFVADLARHIGQTVTIFTTSGGESGRGFTGVLVSVNCNFVRLITQIGSAPGCALGNCCDHRRGTGPVSDIGTGCFGEESVAGADNQVDFLGGTNNNVNGTDRRNNRDRHDRVDCRGNTLGSVVDIPIDKIASFVHNAVGSGW